MRILVDAPTGRQELIKMGDGGSYFDQSRVLWDERIDGNLPSIILGGMVRSGDALIFDQDRMDVHNALPVRTKAIIEAEIKAIEVETIMNRLARELALRTMEDKAAQWSADPAHPAYGVPVATILAGVIGYVKAKAVDDQITALRAEWVTAP